MRRCHACGRAFELTANTAAWWAELRAREGHGVGHLPNRCPECLAAAREAKARVIDDGVAAVLTCVECRVRFLFNADDKAYFARRGWNLPRRCHACRRQARGDRSANEHAARRLIERAQLDRRMRARR